MKLAPLIVASIALWAAVARGEHVRAELVADRLAVAPGEAFTAAVVLTVDPEWHVYWINPGDTGSPPKVKWTLPAGVTAGPLRFPTPGRIDAGDGLTAFGYQKQVALLTTISVPPDHAGDLELSGTLSCVVCHDSCVAEKHPLTLRLPAGKAAPANADRFASWRAQLPTRSEIELPATVRPGAKTGTLDFALDEGTAGVDFFPPAMDNLEYGRPVEQTVGGRRVFRLPYKVLGDAAHSARGTAVVVMKSADGASRATEVHYTWSSKSGSHEE